MKRKTSFMILFLALCTALHIEAQNNPRFKLDDKQKPTLSEYYKQKGKKDVFGHILYSNTSFYNPVFYENVKSEKIGRGNNVDFGFMVNLYPIAIDASFFIGGYDMKNYSESFYDVDYAYLKGANVFLNFFPLPDLGFVSRFIDPYVGFGYMLASLEASKDSDSSSETLGRLNIGGLLWKAGTLINLGDSFYVLGEYRQSLNLNNPKSTYAWSVGLGMKL